MSACRLPGTVTGTTFSGSGASLTNIGTTNMTSVTGTPSSTTDLRGDILGECRVAIPARHCQFDRLRKGNPYTTSEAARLSPWQRRLFSRPPALAPPRQAPTMSSITGSSQCLHVNSSGVVSGTGSDCAAGGGSGTVNSGTQYQMAYYPNSDYNYGRR